MSGLPDRPGNGAPPSRPPIVRPPALSTDAPSRLHIRRRWPSLGASLSLGAVTLVWVLLVLWAAVARIDSFTTGTGRIVPAQTVQAVQSLEGGILSELLVGEGSAVEEGQVVAKISDVAAVSELLQLRAKHLATEASVARLEGEIARREPRFASDLATPEGKAYAGREAELYRARMAELRASLAVIERQRDQRREELHGIEERVRGLEGALAPLRRELAVTQELVEKGHRPQLDLIRIQQRVADTESQMRSASGQMPATRAAIREAEQRLEERQRNFDAQLRGELSQRHAELSATAEALRNLRDRVDRRDLRAPIRGEVKQIRLKSIGGVLQPGQALMEIVPSGDALTIEVPIAPSEIAFVAVGMPARIRVTAYDHTMHGSLAGTVDYVSADAIVNDKGEAFFQIRVRPERNHLGPAERPLPVLPGMMATVDVVTGNRTILGYLLKPVLKATDRALGER